LLLNVEPVGELGEDWPGPRSSHPHDIGVGELLVRLLPFILDLAFDGVQGADEGQGLDRPRVARLGPTKYRRACIQQPRCRMLLCTAL
jgi:hypothetical protein